ncbi:MAG TPA: hypothetical protein VHZ74_02315 [Bryobacteraceae bacterium]|nr:hypothetical protein [Bryobacteraceae bacterium]
MEEAARAIARHLQTLGEISQAVNSQTPGDLDLLLRSIQEHRIAELDAVQRYENHMILHETRVRAAGATDPLG